MLLWMELQSTVQIANEALTPLVSINVLHCQRIKTLWKLSSILSIFPSAKQRSGREREREKISLLPFLHFIASATHWKEVQGVVIKHSADFIPAFYTQEPRHTIAPMSLPYSGTDNRIQKALLRLRNIPLCICSPTYISLSHAHTHTNSEWTTPCFHTFDLDFKNPSCGYACWLCCLSVTDLTVEWCFYRLHRFTCSAAGRLKDKRERGGGISRGGAGGWVTDHLMLPLLHNPTLSNGSEKCWWSRGAEQLKTETEGPRRRKRNGRDRPSSLVYQCKLLTRQSLGASQSLCFPCLAFWLNRHSNERRPCPKARFESLKKNSQPLSL